MIRNFMRVEKKDPEAAPNFKEFLEQVNGYYDKCNARFDDIIGKTNKERVEKVGMLFEALLKEKHHQLSPYGEAVNLENDLDILVYNTLKSYQNGQIKVVDADEYVNECQQRKDNGYFSTSNKNMQDSEYMSRYGDTIQTHC